MGSRGAWTLGHVSGVPVRIHFTWLIVVAYLTAVISAQFQHLAAAADVGGATLLIPPWAWGLLLTLLMFVCVTVHEFAHVGVAQRGGVKVRSVTLMMLGGVSSIDDVDRPRLELAMALAGPLASLIMAGVLYAIFRVSAGWPPDLRFGLFYLAEINLVIGVFNLLPAFPMDGGRVLRSALAGRLGRLRATRVAAGIGKGFALAIGLYGLLSGGWWLILIAAFVYWGGDAESRAILIKQAASRLKVRDLFVRRLVTVPVSASAAEAAAAMLKARRSACLVLDGSALSGLVSADDLAQLPVRTRDGLSVTSVMRPPIEVSVDDELTPTLRRFEEERLVAAAVRDGGELAGTLELDDIARGLALRQRIGAPA